MNTMHLSLCPVTRLPRVAWLAALLLAVAAPTSLSARFRPLNPCPAGGGGAEFSGASQCPPISRCPGAGAGLSGPLAPKANWQSWLSVSEGGKQVQGEWILADDGRTLYFPNVQPDKATR
jgi:hypothetical protein